MIAADGNRNAFLQTYIKSVSFVQAIVLSDRDGTQLNFALADPLMEDKCRQISSMLIAALNQSNDNINKIAKGQKANSLTLCCPGNVVHVHNMKNLVLTIVFEEGISFAFAKEIAKDIAAVMFRLDEQEPEIVRNL